MADKVKHVHVHAYRDYDPAVTAQVLQITNHDKFEKYYRVNTLLTFGHIIVFRFSKHPLQIEQIFQPAVKIILRYAL
jgi:hypothetical protein